MADLSETRLIHVAPDPSHSGVGDYALDLGAVLRPHVKELIEFWVPDASCETARDVARNVRELRSLAEETARRGPVIVHLEQSGGSLTPFWAAMFMSRSTPVTMTVHDAPQPVWWPFDVRSVRRRRLLHHGVHYPFRFAINALQRRACKGRVTFALTSMGARSIAARQPGADARPARIFIPPREALDPLAQRPLAVGLFGHMYRGKGFEHLESLREVLDDDIGIVVAGRGTEALPAMKGITVLGEVNDAAEDAFFASIRFMVVHYKKANIYGRGFPASAAIARSFAYGTPILCNLDGSLPETVEEGGAVSVDGSIEALGRRANEAVRNEDLLLKLADEIARLQVERTTAKCAEPLLEGWTELAAALPR